MCWIMCVHCPSDENKDNTYDQRDGRIDLPRFAQLLFETNDWPLKLHIKVSLCN